MQQPERLGDVLARMQAQLASADELALTQREVRERRSAAENFERQIHRALWRAERHARKVPKHVRRSASYVNAARRRLAHELARFVRSVGGTRELARALGDRAAQRFPRDG